MRQGLPRNSSEGKDRLQKIAPLAMCRRICSGCSLSISFPAPPPSAADERGEGKELAGF